MSEMQLPAFSQGGLPVSADDLMSGLQNMGQTIQSSGGGMPFLRLLKSGRWVYGPENIEPEEDALWAVNIYTLEHGAACWVDSECLGEVLVPFNAPAPNRDELPDYGGPWTGCVSVQLQCLNGEDEGLTVLYKGTSKGQQDYFAELIKQLTIQLKRDASQIIPVIALEVTSYNHKTWGETFKPVLKIEGWVGINADAPVPAATVEEPANVTPEPEVQEPEPEPVAEQVAGEDAEAPASSRRRRRRRDS